MSVVCGMAVMGDVSSGKQQGWGVCILLRGKMLLFAGLALIGVVLVGCGDLPRPFDHTRQGLPSSPLVRLSSGWGVFIRPLDKVPAPFAAGVTTGLVTTLRDMGVPAYFREKTVNWGYSVEPMLREDGIVWAVRAPEGDTVGTVFQPLDLRGGEWASETVAYALGRDVSEQIVVIVEEALGLSEQKRLTGGGGDIHLRKPVAVIAAREEGVQDSKRATLLRDAMMVALQQQGVSVVAALPGQTESVGLPLIEGVLTHTPIAGEGDILLGVEWVVLDVSGIVVGSAKQRNAVPKAMLEEGFEGLAIIIAQAGADGVLHLFARIGEI